MMKLLMMATLLALPASSASALCIQMSYDLAGEIGLLSCHLKEQVIATQDQQREIKQLRETVSDQQRTISALSEMIEDMAEDIEYLVRETY